MLPRISPKLHCLTDDGWGESANEPSGEVSASEKERKAHVGVLVRAKVLHFTTFGLNWDHLAYKWSAQHFPWDLRSRRKNRRKLTKMELTK